MKSFIKSWFLLLVILYSCSSQRRIQSPVDDGKLSVILVQVNDVYEIAPLANGKWGGLARIATLEKEMLKENPNTYLVMAGDFLSPSVYNSLSYQGKRIRGKQMVESMNAAGFDFVIFGNHEFDITEAELQQRINESNFHLISSNAFHAVGDKIIPFAQDSVNPVPLPETFILALKDSDGTTARVGFIGLVLPFNRASYVSYTDPLATAKKLYNQLRDSCDAIVALTHQAIADDERLARELPGLAIIVGGHEHDMRFEKIGNIYITKAHANARTAFVLRMMIDLKKKSVSVTADLKELDETIPLDSSTDAVVQKWIKIANENYASLGFDPKNIVLEKGDSLDGREALVRKQSTNLTELITRAMAAACPDADVVIMNAGSIRVDDILYPPISEYDILRALPFGGGIREVEMRGRLLSRVLDAGRMNKGIGGYLHSYPAIYDSLKGVWMLNNQQIDSNKIYRVGITDFLLTGNEANLNFLNEKNPDITKLYPSYTDVGDPRSDIRLTIITFLKRKI